MTCGRGPRPDDLPAEVLWQTSNLAEAVEVDALKHYLLSEFGTLSILVNNAGMQIEKTILETTDQDWEHVMTAK